VALTGVFLAQNSHEPQNNYFPDARFAAPSYQLDRGVKVVVLNNTYIMSPSTVLTMRYGRNIFNDNNNLPFDFDAHTLGFNKAFADAIPVQKFPTFMFTGYNATGFSGKAIRRYYSDGINGSLTRLAGEHSFKFGADYRILGIKALSYGASAGTYTFNGQFTGQTATSNTGRNAIADLLLGYPSSATITIPSEFDDFVRYSSFYAQDDWRISPRLTLNYGLRLEHETGFAERDNKLITGFDTTTVNPVNVTIPEGIDPMNPTQPRQVKGGLVYAGVNGASEHWGHPPAVKPSPRVGVVFSATGKTVLRGGYGLYWAPWNYTVSQPTGYSSTTTMPQLNTTPISSLDNPFPGGLQAISGNALGLASGLGSTVAFTDPNMTAPRVQQWSVDVQRELPGNMSISAGYIGNKGDRLSYGDPINLNQLDPRYLALGSQLTQSVPNPFFGNPLAGSLSTQQNVQRLVLLAPYPQYGTGRIDMTTNGGRSMYHAAVVQVRKRVSTWWGGNFNYTYSRLKDNQIGQTNYYAQAPGIQDNWNYIPGSPAFNPDVDFGISLLDQTHKLSLSPILQLPFGKGRTHLNRGGLAAYVLGGWSFASVISLQSGFPIGVAQSTSTLNLNGGTQRPSLDPGANPLVPGDIVDRLPTNPADNQYLNPASFTLAPAFSFGTGSRILPGVRSLWRNSVDISMNKELPLAGSMRATLRVEIINLTNTPWFAALSTTNVNAANFAQVTTQGNYSRLAQITLRFSY
jgi:trimeric autotransporter adhesin